ncbi:hypothetical protein [Nocardia sp. XZ_19_385]|uniref:hypothetical protein n=1 Tax=Nocardia sp. XZ_19_385 TaxID=2769488 RepID=UPI00188E1A78|nr:hypothetical protein [Nocardia sp. XZ_19_385]
MSFQYAPTLRLYQNLYDCLSDPGELDVIDAIRAAEIHTACSERCQPRRRAQQTIASARSTEVERRPKADQLAE